MRYSSRQAKITLDKPEMKKLKDVQTILSDLLRLSRPSSTLESIAGAALSSLGKVIELGPELSLEEELPFKE